MIPSLFNPYPPMRFLMAEMFEVLVMGLLVALVANQVSPRGLRLGRDYFRESGPVPGTATSSSAPSPASSPPSSARSVDRLPEIPAAEALRWFEDPRRLSGTVVFVDARAESAFEEGHIPGAYPLDRFYPEQHLPSVVLAGAVAEALVVYCTGGACEDSHYAAHQLVEAGVDRSKVRVYAGGFNEWTARGWPVERGPRGGGAVRQAPQ